jgi:hypothetical protein
MLMAGQEMFLSPLPVAQGYCNPSKLYYNEGMVMAAFISRSALRFRASSLKDDGYAPFFEYQRKGKS